MSSGVLMPFFAEGNDVLFLAGKGSATSLFTVLEDERRS